MVLHPSTSVFSFHKIVCILFLGMNPKRLEPFMGIERDAEYNNLCKNKKEKKI